MSIDTSDIKILLVEDSAPMRKLELMILNKLGFKDVIEAEDGDDAVDKLLENPGISLVISDWNMPVKDGYELLKWFRTTETYKDIPFIMATAQGDRQQTRLAFKAGVSGIISKPFNAEELKIKINEVLNPSESGKTEEESVSRKNASGRVRLRVAHIQITDHLILGVLRHLIDKGELVPEYFELETQCMGSWNPVEDALERGAVDAACILAPIAMDMFGYGIPIRLVLLAHKSGSIFVRNKQGNYARSPRDFFKNKAFLIPHKMSIHHMIAHMFFSEMNLKSGVKGHEEIDVHYEVVAPVMMPRFLKDNPDVSGFMVAEPIGTGAVSSGIADLQFFSGDLWKNHPCCVVAVREDFINEYEAAMYEFTKMLVYAGKKMEQEPEMAAEVGVSFLDPDKSMGLTAQLIEDVLLKSVKTDDLFPVLEDFERIQQYMFTKMGIGKLINLEKFIDFRFAETACKNDKEKKTPFYGIKENESDLDKEENSPAESHEDQDYGDTVRINVDILDQLMTLASELVIVRNQELITTNLSDPAARSISQRLDIVTSGIQETILLTRMQPVSAIFNKFPRIVRESGKKSGKKIQIIFRGRDVEIDKSILEPLAQPMACIVNNCCEHGIETPEQRKKAGKSPEGRIEVNAYKEGGHIHIRIKDDGKGIDPAMVRKTALKKDIQTGTEIANMDDNAVLSLIFLNEFSASENGGTEKAKGLYSVKKDIEKLNGSVSLESIPGTGTTVHLRLPLTLAIIPCLIVASGGFRYAIPQMNLEELVCLYDEDVYKKIETAGDQEVFRLRDILLPLVRLEHVLKGNQHHSEPPSSLNFAVLKIGDRRFGLIVDQIIGTEEIVVKFMHQAVAELDIYSGMTIMGDGRVALILDIEGIARYSGVRFNISEKKDKDIKNENVQSLLVFKIGPEEQFALPLSLVRRVERISIFDKQIIGNKEFITVEGVSTRIIHMDKILNISPCISREEMLLILPRNIHKPVGFLISGIKDTVEAGITLNTESFMEDGLMGTALIDGRMTLFPDIFRLTELIKP